MAKPTTAPVASPLPTVFENEDLIVIIKPAGLLTLPVKPDDRSVKTLFPNYFPVHRLDAETSGLLMLAKNKSMANRLAEQFAGKKIIKRYVGFSSQPGGRSRRQDRWVERLERTTTKTPIRVVSPITPRNPKTKENVSRESETLVDIIPWTNGTILLYIPITGRTHQLRVQSAHHGFPLDGDTKYKGNPAVFLWLHAYALEFMDRKGERHTIVALPKHWEVNAGLKEILLKAAKAFHPPQERPERKLPKPTGRAKKLQDRARPDVTKHDPKAAPRKKKHPFKGKVLQKKKVKTWPGK